MTHVGNHGFVPHPLVKGGNLQTIIGHLTRDKGSFPPEETISAVTKSGLETSILLNIPRCSSRKTPVIILFHEIGSNAESGHLASLARKLVRVGFRTARVNHTPHFHPGATDDIRSAMTAIGEKWPHAPMAISGLSLSGSVILNLLGREPRIQEDFPNLVAALAVCPTMDIKMSRETLSPFRQNYLGRLYFRNDSLVRCDSLADYDENVVASAGEFRDLGEYYRLCSPTHVVKNISLPTLVLAAADDPVNPVDTMMRAPFSDSVTLNIESSGGHLGFYSKVKTRFGDNRWLDESVVSWWQQWFTIKDESVSFSPRQLA